MINNDSFLWGPPSIPRGEWRGVGQGTGRRGARSQGVRSQGVKAQGVRAQGAGEGGRKHPAVVN